MISECHLFEFVVLIEDADFEMGQCTLRAAPAKADVEDPESEGGKSFRVKWACFESD